MPPHFDILLVMFAKLHAKLGDFWWYSLMLFCACRAADVLNAVVGLWLVPKYVGPSELGAVMPLTNFANFLAIPVAAFANTFRSELTWLSIRREFGKLKSLMRGVFIATAIFLFIAIVAARFLLPVFFERIRIVEGSLGIIIIAAAFVSAIAPIYSSALQALKKFKAQSLLSIVGAPVRLVTMLVAMPFRALTGYFVGQASVPVFNIFASVISLRKELAAPAEPYWNKETASKFSKLFATFLLWAFTGGFYTLVESTVIRQRLPDLDSAGYYMVMRLSEIATYLYGAMIFTFFPFAAELWNNGRRQIKLIFKATAVNLTFCTILAAGFCFIARPILSVLPSGAQYAAYWWAIPWQTMILGLLALHGFYTTAEIAANRFGFLTWAIPLELIYPVLLLAVTGHGYLTGFIPQEWSDFLVAHNIYTLDSMFWWMTAIAILKALACTMAMAISHWRNDPTGNAH